MGSLCWDIVYNPGASDLPCWPLSSLSLSADTFHPLVHGTTHLKPPEMMALASFDGKILRDTLANRLTDWWDGALVLFSTKCTALHKTISMTDVIWETQQLLFQPCKAPNYPALSQLRLQAVGETVSISTAAYISCHSSPGQQSPMSISPVGLYSNAFLQYEFLPQLSSSILFQNKERESVSHSVISDFL